MVGSIPIVNETAYVIASSVVSSERHMARGPMNSYTRLFPVIASNAPIASHRPRFERLQIIHTDTRPTNAAINESKYHRVNTCQSIAEISGAQYLDP